MIMQVHPFQEQCTFTSFRHWNWNVKKILNYPKYITYSITLYKSYNIREDPAVYSGIMLTKILGSLLCKQIRMFTQQTI